MAALTAAVLAACLSVLNITLAVRSVLRDRRDRRALTPPPLAAPLYEIAAAIRAQTEAFGGREES